MNRRFRTFAVWAAALFLTSLALSTETAVPASGALLRVLILSGQNNHDWKSTTPKLVDILTASGRFDVHVTEDPGALTPDSLGPFDVLVSNWNAFGLDEKAAAWPEKVRLAYLDFARRGGGHVVVHAGGASFPGWNEYGRLALATWKNGQTTHGPVHEFPVRFEDVRHPVTDGLGSFTIKDELWNAPGLAEGAEVLASSFSASDRGGTGRWEPAVMAGGFGKGRSLTILLGHDAEAMDNPGFQALLLRAVEWAATGRVEPGQAARSYLASWSSAEMSFFTPAVLRFEPLTLRAGEAILLRYRVLVHPDRWGAARLQTEAARFSSIPSQRQKE